MLDVQAASLGNPEHEEIPNAFLSGNFAPVGESTAFDLAVTGRIPPDLQGRFVRIGPNPVAVSDPENHHWFTGDGMVHGLCLRDGRAVWHRSRYVLGDSTASALGRPRLNGPRENWCAVNTNVVVIGGKSFAVVEAGGLPIELSPELESLRHSDLDGSLPRGFTAHPRLDPVTGEYHAINYRPGDATVDHVIVCANGRARVASSISLPHGPMIHDTAITASSVIVLDLPVTLQPNPGRPSLFPYVWDDRRTPRVGLLPRSSDASSPRWFEAPRCFVYHILNAFDEADGRTVLDVVRHPRMFATERRGPGEGVPVLARWTLDDATGRLAETILHEGCEFPRLNDAFSARAHRFGYTTSFRGCAEHGPLHKHDFRTGHTAVHDLGPGRAGLEPVFVARHGASEEDDGFLLAYVYDAGRNASDVIIINARDFDGEPEAVIRLPVRVPFGFHGAWLPDPPQRTAAS